MEPCRFNKMETKIKFLRNKINISFNTIFINYFINIINYFVNSLLTENFICNKTLLYECNNKKDYLIKRIIQSIKNITDFIHI